MSGAGPGWRAAGAGHATGCGWRRPWAPATTPRRQGRLWVVEEVYAVVGAHGRRLVGRVGVEDAYGERLVHVPADLPWGPPVDCGGLLGGLGGAGDRFGAEDQGDHAKVHVLVHPGQPHRAYGQPGLLVDLAAQPVVNGLAELQDAPGQLPVLVVAAADHQRPPFRVDDGGGDADRMTRRAAHDWAGGGGVGVRGVRLGGLRGEVAVRPRRGRVSLR